ncbi:MAG: hypothetical protein KAG97_12230, partial [Victivallales bacterium]|nr:hypothetical protein [Victivallales bacterium]
NLPLISTIRNLFATVKAFFSGDLTFFEAGKKLLITLGKGIWSAVTYPFNMLKNALGKLRKLLPFSDAKEGPLSSLTTSGKALLETLANGMNAAKNAPSSIFKTATQGILSSLSGAWNGIRNAGKAAMTHLAAPLKNGNWGALAEGAVQAGGRIKAALSNVIPKLPIPDFVRNILPLPRQSVAPNLTMAQPAMPMVAAQAPAIIPATLSAVLMLTPVLASALPDTFALSSSAIQLSAPDPIAVAAQVEPKIGAIPSIELAGDKPASELNEAFQPIRLPEISTQPHNPEKLATVRQSSNTPRPREENLPNVAQLLEALLGKIDALADRPIDVSVATHIDGRQVAEAVYKNQREQKIRNYGTL